MTERFAQLHARSRGVAQLGTVITAMRGIAAARVQQSQGQLAGVRAYADLVARAISQVIAVSGDARPEPPGAGRARAMLVFGAEHGFAGAYTERVLEAAGLLGTGDAAEAGRAPAAVLVVVGSRGVRLARAQGLAPVWTAPMASQLANAGALADAIAAQIYRLLHAGRADGVEIVYARPRATAGVEVVRRRLLPLDFARFAPEHGGLPPLLNLAPGPLLERLAGEYLFAELNEAIVHSYAAENLARLQTMTTARENVHERLATLTREERLARQEEITDEIIELAAGSRASA